MVWTSVRSGNEFNCADLTSMLIKSVVFGLLISIIACGYGLTTKGGPKEVGTSNGAVVMTRYCIFNGCITNTNFI